MGWDNCHLYLEMYKTPWKTEANDTDEIVKHQYLILT